MKQQPIHKLFSSYLLVLLILWTSTGQAMGKKNCCCFNLKTTFSCCSVKKSIKKSCSSVKEGCTKLQLSTCSCNKEAQWQPQLPSQEQALESSFNSVFFLLYSSWKVTLLPRAIYWELLKPNPLQHYIPPLLYRDVPILVQSFLL